MPAQGWFLRSLVRRSKQAVEPEASPEPARPFPLFGQVDSAQLRLLASQRPGFGSPPDSAEDAPDGSPARAPSRRSALKRVLPFILLAIGLAMAVGMGIGVTDALTDGDVTVQDAIRLSIMGLATLTLAGPAAVLAATFPGRSAFAALLSRIRSLPARLVPARGPQSSPSDAMPPLLLGQLSNADLMRLAPGTLGQPDTAERALHRSSRLGQTLAWIALVVAVTAVLVIASVVLAFGAIQSLVDGDSVSAAIVIRLALAAASAVGALLLALTGIAALADRRRRRMKRLIQRMLRYLLRLFDGGVHAVQMAGASVFGSFRVAAQASGSGGGLAGSLASGGLGALARLGLAALVVGGLGVVPFVAGDSAFGIDLPGRDGGGDGVVAGASATPRPTSRPATPTPSPRTLTPSPTASPSPTPTPAPTAAPTAPPTTRPPTPIPVTPPPEVPPLADYCIYDKGIPQPSGTATDYADYAEQWFQVTNNYRAGFGLLPLDRDSRLDAAAREHAQFVVLRQWQDVYGGDERIHCDDRSRDEVNRAFDAGYPFVVIAENVAWGDVGLPIQDTFNNACGPRDASPRCPWNEDPAGEVNPEDGRSIAFHKTGVACYTRPDLQLFACAQVLAE